MDDQFNGRTDDDLFADDFEPVEAQQEAPPTVPDKAAQPAVQNKTQSVNSEQIAAAVQPTPAQHAPRSLDQSRHAGAQPASTPPSSSHQHQPHHQHPRKHSPKPAPAAGVATPPESPQDTRPKTSSSGGGDPNTPNSTSTPNPNPNHQHSSAKKRPTSPAKPGQNTALADRLASGANPRTKLTDSELAAKMEQMRLLAAEKTRRFEQAERDSRSHAAAYEKGMEEARKRRAEDAERRRRGAEERRRMDEERAANRERKLKAMGAKEGGSWDEGKAFEEERDRRAGFRGANGGVRGSKNMGMAGSRFAERESESVPREFGFDDFRGRGRGGRGRGGSRGGGRGGRGGFNNEGRQFTAQNGSAPQQQKPAPAQAPPTVEDFPALPTPKKLDTTTKAPDTSALSPSLNSPPIGKWDDEMAALDEKA